MSTTVHTWRGSKGTNPSITKPSSMWKPAPIQLIFWYSVFLRFRQVFVFLRFPGKQIFRKFFGLFSSDFSSETHTRIHFQFSFFSECLFFLWVLAIPLYNGHWL